MTRMEALNAVCAILEPLAVEDRRRILSAARTLSECDDVLDRFVVPAVSARTAMEHVRLFFEANPEAKAKPSEVGKSWPHKQTAVQQAMHRLAKSGDLVRLEQCRYAVARSMPRLVGS